MIRRILIPSLALSALAAGMLYRPRLLVRQLAKTTDEVLFYVETEEKMTALTIDDGPHPRLTPLILDVLAQHDAKATFFILGEQVAGNEYLLQRIVDEGHELGNHLMTDDPSIRLPAAEFERQLLHTHELLAPFADVRWFRPGSGWYNQRMLDQLAEHGFRCALGSVYPYDAQIPLAPFLSTYILLNTFPGAIIAMHDGAWDRRRTVDVLGQVLPRLLERGYGVVTLSELAEKARTIATDGDLD